MEDRPAAAVVAADSPLYRHPSRAPAAAPTQWANAALAEGVDWSDDSLGVGGEAYTTEGDADQPQLNASR